MKTSDLKPGDVLTVTFTDSIVLSVHRGTVQVQTAHDEVSFGLDAPDVCVSDHRRPIQNSTGGAS